jgi:hypothetical protein
MLYTTLLTVILTIVPTGTALQPVRLTDIDREAALTHLRAGQEALATERYEAAEREFREAI